MKEILLTLVTAVAAYLLGCISTGTIVSRREGVNIRNEGSHNTGASNVLRVLGLKDGLITFLGDFAKAALACLIGNLLVQAMGMGAVKDLWELREVVANSFDNRAYDFDPAAAEKWAKAYKKLLKLMGE